MKETPGGSTGFTTILQSIPDHCSVQTVRSHYTLYIHTMEDLFNMEDIFYQCDEDFCPPPMFDLPPPPPPPWLDTPAGCRDVGGCGDMPTVHSLDQNVEEIFHSISIIVVSALVIVISVIFAALLVYR